LFCFTAVESRRRFWTGIDKLTSRLPASNRTRARS